MRRFAKSTKISFIILLSIVVASYGQVDLPVKIVSSAIQGASSEQCPASEQISTKRQNLQEDVSEAIHSSVLSVLQNKYTSCGCAQRDSSWYQIAFLNMSDTTVYCPTNWNTINTPVRACGKRTTTGPTCNSVTFSSDGRSYSQVCGRLIGLQRGSPNAFNNSVTSPAGTVTIDDAYIDGISITRGSPREHVWTFVNAYYETVTNTTLSNYLCPCMDPNWPYQVPSFVGSDYFCATGIRGSLGANEIFYPNDPLWDGAGCGLSSSCCQFNQPPWFCKTLSSVSSQDLQIRICGDQVESNENTYITFMEIYIK